MSRLSRLTGRVLAAVPHATPPPRHKVRTVRFRRLVRNLRGLVDLSEDAADKLGGEWILDRSYVAAFVAQTLDRAREIVFDATLLCGAPSSQLYARLDAVRSDLARLMEARSTSLPTPTDQDAGMGRSAHLQELEYRLLLGAMRRLALTGEATPGARHRPGEPRLAEVVSEAHEAALQSLAGLRFESWGRRAGKPLVGTSLPGMVRVVDVGGGVASPGKSVWRPRVERDRIRSAPLRTLAGAGSGGPGSTSRGVNTLAVVTEEHATVDVAWSEGSLLVDACLGENAAANVVYCARRGEAPRGGASLDAVIDGKGFRRLGLGPGLTGWLQGRGHEDSRCALERLGGALRELPGDPGGA